MRGNVSTSGLSGHQESAEAEGLGFGVWGFGFRV